MNKPSLAWKVGLFVFVGLVMLAGLLLQFSKGLVLFHRTNTIYVRAPDVVGLKPHADVLMSGVKVGSVSEIRLGAEGRSAIIVLKIYPNYRIYKDARFVLEPSGLLGDEYVAIIPTQNRGPVLANGANAVAEAPFNLEEFARSAGGLIQRLDQTVVRLDAMIDDVRKYLLNEPTLTNFSALAGNLRTASERAITTLDRLNELVWSNSPAVSESVSNLAVFSSRVNDFAGRLNGVVESNRAAVAATVKNLEASSQTLNGLLADVRSGKGLAGALFENPQLATDMSLVASNLSVTTSNLNRLGLWGVLWSHKPRKPSSPPGPRPLASPKESEAWE